MSDPLDSARSKFDRAKGHVQTLIDDIETWMDHELEPPWIYRQEYKAHRGLRVVIFYTVKAKPIRDTWPQILGDAIQNFRASLNHAAYQVVLNGTKPEMADHPSVQFPICVLPDPGNGCVGSRLPGVRDRHLKIIKEHQPYKRGQDAPRDPLAILAKLTNTDKHRRLLLIQAITRGYRIHHPGFTANILTPADPWQAMKPGAEAVRVYLTPLAGQEPDVDVNLEPHLDILTEERAWVREHLAFIEGSISEVLDELSGTF